MASANRLCFGFAAWVCLCPGLAFADESPSPQTPATAETPSNTSQADALFQEGKRLLEEGKLIDACEKLAQSDALDPAIGTLGLLAACHEQEGRTATAYREYNETAVRASRVGDEREAFARERATALEPGLARLLVRFAKPIPNAVVLRNGIRIAPEELGAAIPVDPGTYEIVARFQDKPEFRATVPISATKTVEVEVPDPYWTPPPKPPVAPVVLVEKPKQGLGPLKIGAIVSGGVGAIGFGVTIAAALSAASKNASSIRLEQSCATAESCAKGRSLREQAFASATVANLAFGVGAVGAVTALVLGLLPERKSETHSVSARTSFTIVPSFSSSERTSGAFLVGTF